MTETRSQRSLEVLLDKQEIHELHARYCRGIDRMDPDLIRSVFHEDATEHHPPWYEGSAIAYVDSAMAQAGGPQNGPWFHMFSNELIDVQGDVAYSEMYLFNVNRIEDQGFDFILAGRYVERLERRNGEWRIAWRSRVTDITRVENVGKIWSTTWPDFNDNIFGKRSGDDISYHIPRAEDPETPRFGT